MSIIKAMGIIVKQTENRSELQKRIAKELSDKAKKKNPNPADLPDGVEDAAYTKDTKQTTSLAWVWILITIVGVGALVWFVVASGN
mgnify:CR=1 FL=1